MLVFSTTEVGPLPQNQVWILLARIHLSGRILRHVDFETRRLVGVQKTIERTVHHNYVCVCVCVYGLQPRTLVPEKFKGDYTVQHDSREHRMRGGSYSSTHCMGLCIKLQL